MLKVQIPHSVTQDLFIVRNWFASHYCTYRLQNLLWAVVIINIAIELLPGLGVLCACVYVYQMLMKGLTGTMYFCQYRPPVPIKLPHVITIDDMFSPHKMERRVLGLHPGSEYDQMF